MTSVSKSEALSALSEIDSVTRRGMALKGYRHAGPFLMLWGVVWGLGYLGMAYLAPDYWGWLWLGLDLAGAIGSLILAPKGGTGAHAAVKPWRMVAGMGACVAFVLAIVAVFPKTELLPYIALPGLFVGFLYTVLGVTNASPRYVWIGVAVFVATLAGYYLWPQYLAQWLALVGGGGLFLGGLWLRSV